MGKTHSNAQSVDQSIDFISIFLCFKEIDIYTYTDLHTVTFITLHINIHIHVHKYKHIRIALQVIEHTHIDYM